MQTIVILTNVTAIRKKGKSRGKKSVYQKQPDQTESEAKPNTSGLQSGTETQSCSPAEITLHIVSTSTQHTLQRRSTIFDSWPLQMKQSLPGAPDHRLHNVP